MRKHLAKFVGALTLAAATPALSDTLVMQCEKHACARERCDDWGENCSRIGYFERTNTQFAAPASHQVCNEFGDCHFTWPTYPPVKETPPPAAPPVVSTH